MLTALVLVHHDSQDQEDHKHQIVIFSIEENASNSLLPLAQQSLRHAITKASLPQLSITTFSFGLECVPNCFTDMCTDDPSLRGHVCGNTFAATKTELAS